MNRDDRLYAFIVAGTSRSRSCIRRITIHTRWLKVSAGVCLALLCAALYGFYALTQQAAHLRIEHENRLLREENKQQREQLNKLKTRVEAVEGRVVELAGATEDGETNEHGAGGPLIPLDAEMAAAIERRAAHLERMLDAYENILRQRAAEPSIWPVKGNLTDGFGARRDPFGGASSEFHAGQDIATAWGTEVIATGSGEVSFAGTQNGYGQLVIIDHGGGLTTRYGHLSKIEVTAGQSIARGQVLGRVGSTGRSTGPHLHYEVRINEGAVNPKRYLPPLSTE